MSSPPAGRTRHRGPRTARAPFAVFFSFSQTQPPEALGRGSADLPCQAANLFSFGLLCLVGSLCTGRSMDRHRYSHSSPRRTHVW
ncbi:hypothetical protein [Pandoravirus japonicus]|uniref:Uncharacterized protein n=1 Tax=Pandoravirus japonicus TaxID=2823154 RepID=A0A811BQE2_9VIRU|nr:hypothetical protein [Pandoravirus japonicus]